MKLNDYFENQFQCLVTQREDIDFGKKFLKLDYDVSLLSFDELTKLLKCREVFLKLTKKGVGTIILSLFIADEQYDYFQKKYKEDRAYFFWANNNFAYFKILQNGKIQRKIASRGWFNNHLTSSEEGVIGKPPCEYEIENNLIYKIKGDEFLKFSKADLLDIFDYYSVFKRDDDIEFDNVQMFYNLNSLNVDYGMQMFSRPEFIQSLFHIGKNYEAEYTVPMLIFEDSECLRSDNFIERVEVDKIKNDKNILKLNIFNKNKKSYIKTDLIYRPGKCSLGSFIFDLSQDIQKALKVKEELKDPAGVFISGGEGEFIPTTTSVVYFIVCFEQTGIKLKFYSSIKNGKAVKNDHICSLDEFSQEKISVCYNQILDYVLDQDLMSKITKN